MPPTFDGEVLRYVDLDIGILVKPDFSYQLIDLDDFETNARRYDYPDEVRENVRLAVEDLTHMIESRAFPFNSQ
jgi:protein associated with RNAse G/E